MRAVLETHLADASESQERFVHERRGRQRVPVALLSQVVIGELLQLLIDDRNQNVERLDVPQAPALQ